MVLMSRCAATCLVVALALQVAEAPAPSRCPGIDPELCDPPPAMPASGVAWGVAAQGVTDGN